MKQGELEGMPEPAPLRLLTADGQVLVTHGRTLVYRYEADDTGMRNLAIVALTDAGPRIDEVARLFGLTATYVSMLRGRARRGGSAALVRHRRGRPPKLTDRQVAQAQVWAGSGWTQQAIADQLKVARSVISELLARVGPAPVQDALTPTGNTDIESESEETVAGPDDTIAATNDIEPTAAELAVTEPATAESTGTLFGSARASAGVYRCRYAGAMLLYPYLHKVGAEAVFATLTGGPARRYSDLAVLTTATVGFALGVDTVEGTKHLRRADAGAALGLGVAPQLATLRTRLSALADGSDPLALQRSFAAGMLKCDPAPDPVYFVDDHFVAYSGARPVAKGWNTKRRHAQPGLDDTLVVDARGRAVVFGTGEPTGLVSTLPGVLAQLRQVTGPDLPIMLGFDRGGAYPSAFTACRIAGADWVTYRRAPLVAATAAPRRSWTLRDGKRVAVMLADEMVQLPKYGQARQLTLFEQGAPVLQVLTSDTTATGASLLCWLRARWRIENMFKYAAAHNGIDTLADYGMDIGPDHRKVKNPARVGANKTVSAADAELATAERALPQLLNGPGTPKQKNAALPAAHRRIEQAITALGDAKTAQRPIPAKVLATDLDPDAKLARPHLGRRGLQMVLRLLAFNAEAWLAEHFNAYLADPDEYRAILRNLLHLGGNVDYTRNAITVTLERPDSPRVARALQLLTEELNLTPATIPGDRRPLTYRLAEA